MAHFDRFDICEAYYLFACHYHGGQFTKEYAILGRLEKFFRPRPDLSIETLSENAQEIYQALAEYADLLTYLQHEDPLIRREREAEQELAERYETESEWPIYPIG